VLPCLNAPASTSQDVNRVLLDELTSRGAQITVAEQHISDVSIRLGLVAKGAGWLTADASGAQALVATNPGVVFREWVEKPIRFPCSLFWRRDDRSALVGNFVSTARRLRQGRRRSSRQPVHLRIR
jgi:hypothetical protein